MAEEAVKERLQQPASDQPPTTRPRPPAPGLPASGGAGPLSADSTCACMAPPAPEIAALPLCCAAWGLQGYALGGRCTGAYPCLVLSRRHTVPAGAPPANPCNRFEWPPRH